MRRIILLITVAILAAPLSAQYKYHIGPGYSFDDRGVALRLGIKGNANPGYYFTVESGTYPEKDPYHIKDHFKFSAGVLIGGKRQIVDWWPVLSAGIAFNSYTTYPGYYNTGDVAFWPFDLEFGASGQIWHLSPFVSVLVFKWDWTAGVVYVFGKYTDTREIAPELIY